MPEGLNENLRKYEGGQVSPGENITTAEAKEATRQIQIARLEDVVKKLQDTLQTIPEIELGDKLAQDIKTTIFETINKIAKLKEGDQSNPGIEVNSALNNL